MKSTNIPEVKLGIVAVSRDCFPIQLSEKRRAAIVAACQAKGLTCTRQRPLLRTRRTWRRLLPRLPRLAAML